MGERGFGKGEREGGLAYGDDIPPGRPLGPDLPERLEAGPVGPAAVDYQVAEQRAGEEQGGQEQDAERVPQRDRPEPEEVQRLKGRRGTGAGARDHHVGGGRAGEA